MMLPIFFRVISILAYCFIILTGDFIGVPLIFVLAGDLFANSNIIRISAILAFIGLGKIIIVNMYSKTGWTFLTEIVAFIFLLLPLIVRITSMSISLFNYGAFILPVCIFILFYLLSLFFSYRTILKGNNKL